jgi:hypothetical protein
MESDLAKYQDLTLNVARVAHIFLDSHDVFSFVKWLKAPRCCMCHAIHTEINGDNYYFYNNANRKWKGTA